MYSNSYHLKCLLFPKTSRMQAQPDTFHPSILALQTPVSFHRHRPEDPYTIYQRYLNQSSTETGTNADTMTSRANAASNAGIIAFVVMQATVEPPNTGHVGDEHFVHCLEVVPSSEVEIYGQYVSMSRG